MGIDFAILGPLEVRADGRILPLGSPKQRSLLALLLVHANETVSRDRLIDELWGDAPPATVESGFHVYLSRLRRLLDSVGGRGALVRETHGYRLRVGPDQLDATRFESLVGEGNEALAAGRAELAAARFREALALWRGPALADVESEPFATAARARLEEARVSALEQRLEADLGLARHRQLIGELETLVSQHPYRERLRAQLMLALYRSGRQAEALRAYQEARRTLADVLGLEPGQGLKELEQAILRQDPILEVERPAEPEPPPRPATSLPIAPTPLIGRERELEEAARLLGAHRLVTLTGPGGSGKTRLALQLAADAVDAFRDGVVWVELQSLRDPELVLPTIARALGTDEMFSEGTADRHALLVLDNFEHLLAAAPGVGDLPGRLPRSKLLVTSREPLRVAAEYEYPVAPLREREAVALFVERARAARPRFQLTGGNATAVAEICARVDKLPLAIELAAARTRLLAPEALLGRLDQRLPLLTGGARDAPERHQTLRATIDWSYRLLGEAEQGLFARLSVFAGGCTFDAVNAVCLPESQLGLDALAGMDRLVQTSLLRSEEQPGGQPRFVMLETLREYANERLEESGEAEVIRRRHAEYFLGDPEDVERFWRPEETAERLRRVYAELENLRFALDWAHGTRSELELALAVLYQRGHAVVPADARARLEAALANGSPQRPQLRARALAAAGGFARQQLDFAVARERLEESLRLYRDLQDLTGEAMALARLRALATMCGDENEELRLAHEIDAVARRSGDPILLSLALQDSAIRALVAGERGRARELLNETVSLLETAKGGYALAHAHEQLALVDLLDGDVAGAIGKCQTSLDLQAEYGEDYPDKWPTLEVLAAALAAAGEHETAIRVYAALGHWRETRGQELWLMHRRLGSLDEQLFGWLDRAFASPEFAAPAAAGRRLDLPEATRTALDAARRIARRSD